MAVRCAVVRCSAVRSCLETETETETVPETETETDSGSGLGVPVNGTSKHCGLWAVGCGLWAVGCGLLWMNDVGAVA